MFFATFRVVFLGSVLLQTARVCDADCSSESYVVPDYLSCSHMNVASTTMGGTCEASDQQNVCGRVIDGDSDAGSTNDWYSSADPAKDSNVKIFFAIPYLINTIRVMQRGGTTGQNKGIRLEFSDGSQTKIELDRNTGTTHTALATWDVRTFEDITTSWVKLVVETEYANNDNGFKEIEFYHNNCNRDKLCDTLVVPEGKTAEARAVYGKTAYFMASGSTSFTVRLYSGLDLTKNVYSIVFSDPTVIHRINSAGESSSEATVSTQLVSSNIRRVLWIDFRSSKLVVGYGAQVIVEWPDPDPFEVKYIGFYSSGPSTDVIFCNRKDKCYHNADHYWPLDKITAGSVFDLNGQKHGETRVSFPSMGPPVDYMSSGSITLDTSSSKYIDFGDFHGTCVSDLSVCQDGLTVSLWVYVPTIVSSDQIILASSTYSVDRGFYMKFIESESTVSVKATDMYLQAQLGVKIKKGAWYHVAFAWTRKAKRLLIVVNGLRPFTANAVIKDLRVKNSTNLVAGHMANYAAGSKVQLSNVAIWKRPFSVLDVQNHFHCSNFFLYSQNCAGVYDSVTCGWGDISEHDCAAMGCCYSEGSCTKVARDSSMAKLGVGSSSVTHLKMTASSAKEGKGAPCGRLSYSGDLWNELTWIPLSTDLYPYLQIDLSQVFAVGGVATKGLNSDPKPYVKTYILSYSTSGVNWLSYKVNGAVQVLTGNTDGAAVVKNTFTPAISARCIRIHPKSWHVEVALQVELFGTNTATNYAGCFKDTDFIAAGDYDYNMLTPEKCTTSCGLAQYSYAALKKGKECYCENTIDDSNIVGDSRCDEPCSGNLILRCGGAEYFSVYRALGSFGSPLGLTIPQEQKAFELFNVTFASFPGATFELDFGENFPVSSQTLPVSYMYHSTGRFIVVGETTTGEYGEPERLLMLKEVNVYNFPEFVEFQCPSLVVADEEFFCEITVYQGTNLTLEAHPCGSSALSITMDDAHSLSVGELFQSNELAADPGPRTVLIPAYYFEDDGRHVGWELYVEKSGYITMQIFRPVCGRGTDNKYCYTNGSCQTAVKTCTNRGVVTCSSGETFSTASSTCVTDNVQPIRPAVPTPDDVYELIKENHVYLSSSGRHLIHFTGSLKDNISAVRKGDIIGYFLPAVGFAHLVSRNASKSELFNVEELIYDRILSVGDIVSTVTSSPKILDAQRSVIAFHQGPSQFKTRHNCSIGVYPEEITVKGGRNVLSATARIVASQSIIGLNWTHPQFIATNETFDIIIHPHPGYNISYVMSYGGENLTDFKTTLTSDLHFTYTFNKRGEYRVSLWASNSLTYAFKACTIIVQDLIKNVSFYTPIKPTALNNITAVDWLMRQGSSLNITVSFGDGIVLNNGTFDVAFLWVATYYHIYADIGEYHFIINVSNMVSNASIEGLAVVEVPIEGFDFDVVHGARDIEVNETITVQVTIVQGTNPEFLVDFGDGSIVTSRDLAIQHSYAAYNLYNISVWAYNNVSDRNATHEIKVHKPVEDLIGFNVSCPPGTNLTDATPCMLNITMGTDFRCTWDWGDGQENETTDADLGNFTYHNYSSIGHYQVAVNCTNRLYNTTTATVAIVEKPILEFTVDPPGGRPYDQDFTVHCRTLMGTDAIFNITFTHVISGTAEVIAITTLTADTTAFTALITTSQFPVIGIYELNVTAVNHVTPLQVIILTVYIDIPIVSPVLTRLHEFFTVNGAAPFEVTMTQGSNVTLHFDYGDAIKFTEFIIGEFPANGSSITHAYQGQGVFCVVLFGNNSVGNFTLQSCITIQAPTDAIILSSNSPQPIPPGMVSLDATVTLGELKPENVTYSIDYGDGNVDLDKKLSMPMTFNHTYVTNGAYFVNMSIKNDVSNASIQLEVEVQTPIEGLQLFVANTAGDAGAGQPGRGPHKNYFPLDYPVMFNSLITNGTNVTYRYSFGGISTNETQVNYTFTHEGHYIVEVSASNAINVQRMEVGIILQKIVKVTFTNDGPTEIDSQTTFTLSMEQVGTDACYFVQLDNDTTYLFKELTATCSDDCPSGKILKFFDGSPITIVHEYKTIDVFPVKAIGCNIVSKLEVLSEAAVVSKPCSYPNVTVDPQLAGPNITAPKTYLKSVPLSVSVDIEINCEASDVSTKEWVICKLESDMKTCRPVSLPADLMVNARDLKLPKRTLDYGLYIFKFTVTMVGVKGIYTTGEGYVNIKESDIIAEIAGGTSKAVGHGLPITLDAGNSMDPDLAAGNYTGMKFYWFCAKKGETVVLNENSTRLPTLPIVPLAISNATNASRAQNETGGCFGYGPGRLNATGMLFTFDTRWTVIDEAYEVTVLVTKDRRMATATMTIIPKEGDPPDVNLVCKLGCEGRKKINPSEKLTLIGSAVCSSCFAGQTLNYLWSIMVESTPGEWKEVSDSSLFLATPESSKNAVVKPHVLKGGIRYRFILYSWIPSAKSRGFCDFVRVVNKPPTRGTCEISPTKGYTMTTEFSVTCEDWSDMDNPLEYTLITVDADGSETDVVSWRGNKGVVNEVVQADGIKLPEGPGEGGNLTVVVEVSDTEGSVSRISFFVQVGRPALDEGQKATLLDEGEKELQKLMAQGNSDAAMSHISNMVKFMGPKSSGSTSEGDDKAEAERINKMMGQMLNVRVTDPKGAAKKAKTLATMLSDPRKLSDNAKLNAAKALADSAEMLHKASPGQLKKLGQNMANAIGSAIPKSQSKSESPDGKGSTTSPVNVTAQKLMSESLQRSVAKVKSASLNVLATNEEPTVVKSPSLSMAMAKKQAKDLAGISCGGSSFKGLGNAVQNNNSDEAVGMETAAFDGNPFAYTNGSEDVSSGVSEISLKHDNGTPMAVKNLETPFEMIVENKNPPKAENLMLPLDEPTTLKMDVKKNRSAILVQVYPRENNTQVIICLKKCPKPSSFDDCDFILVIPNFGVGNDTNANPYSMLIQANALNYTGAGTWYVKLMYNGTFGTAEGSVAPEVSNCTVYLFEVSTLFMNETTGEFESGGMQVGPETTPTQIHLIASHMTSFASDFVVAPNKIDFSKVSLSELMNNPLVFIVVLSFYGLYGLLCIWGRHADKKDLEKIGVTPLQDNDPRDTYMYEIVIYTGFNSHSGTTSEIRMILAGGLDETSPRSLRDPDPTRRKFCRGSVDYFLMSAPRSLGKLKSIRIWHDNTGSDPSWFLLRLMVHDLQSDTKTWFICDRWMAVEEDDGMVDRTLVPASKEDLTSFNLLFSTEARKNLSDNHLWFSVIARPVKSTFTRVQRLTCCLSILMSTMLANAMFYQVDDKSSTGTSLRLGPLSFSVKQVSIAITSSLVVLPANLLILTMFRKARPPEAKKTGLDKDQDPHGQSQKYEFDDVKADKEEGKDDEKDNEGDDKDKKKKKKKATLPHYFVYVAYALAFVAANTTAAFTVFYGLTFGKEKSAKWISCMMLSFWQDVLISQPLKVFAAAMFFALVIKDPNKAEDENDENNELTQDEEAIHKEVNENDEEKTLLKMGFISKPPDPEKLEIARQLKLKQKAMKQIIREMIFYFMFLSVLLFVAYGNRDPVAFKVTEAIRSIVQDSAYTGVGGFEDSSDATSYWSWAMTSFIPTLKPRYWYGPVVQFNQKELLDLDVKKSKSVIRLKKKKGKKWVNVNGNYVKDFDVLHRYKEGYIADRATSYLVGSPRLRILRIKKDQCKLVNTMTPFFKDCMAKYDWDYEDQDQYHSKWIPMASNETVDKEKEATPWQYQTAWKLKGTPYWGKFATYWGGGYVADFGADRDKSEALAKELQPLHWIDRYTRAIFSEFTIYNAPANFFCVVTLLMEILPTGGYYPNSKIQTIRLYRVGPEMAVIMAFELVYMGCLFFFLYKQVKKYRQVGRKEYFSDGWNYMEFFVLLFSISAVAFYIIRMGVTKYTITNMQESPDRFVSFQYAAFLDELVTVFTSMAVFCSILKFLRLLRFNKRVALVIQTIKLSVSPLLSFFLMFFIIFFAYAQFAFIIFGIDSDSYASFPNTLSSMLSLTLGSFDFQEMRAINRILGPAFFFSFVLVMFFVLMNVFISILSDAFNEVNSDLSKQSNEHELLSFMLNSVKRTVGKQVAPDIKPKYKEPKTKFELNIDSIEDMSENIEYAMRNLAMEDIRQTNWFDMDAATKKKRVLIKMLLETDEDFLENDLCDSIPLFDKLLAKNSEEEMIELLVYYREMKKHEDARSVLEKMSLNGDGGESGDESVDDSGDDDSPDDGDANNDDSDPNDENDVENAPMEEGAVEGRLTSLDQEKIMDEIVVVHSRAQSRANSANVHGVSQV